MSARAFFLTVQRSWLLVLLFLIPFSLDYLTKEPFAISWLNGLSVGFIGLGVLNILLGSLKIKPVEHKPFLILLGIFLLAMAYALLFTHPLRNGIGLWTSRLVQPMLVGWFAYQLVANGVVSIQSCLKALFWSLVGLILVGGLQVGGVIPFRNPGRVTASYFQPNTFARYVDLLLLLTLPWILFQLKRNRRLYLGIWLLGVVLLLTTKSYNGVVSLGAGLAAFFLLLPKPFYFLQRVGLVLLIAVGLVTAFNVTKLPKWQTSITDSRLTRLEFWRVAEGVLKADHHFWTGVGIKGWETNYSKWVLQYAPYPPLNYASVQPHNVFLDSLLKAGLPGLFAITAFLVWPLVEGVGLVRSYSKHDPDWWFGLSMATISLAMLVFGLIDDPLWSDDTMPLYFVLFFLLAWAMSHKRLNDSRAT